MAKKVELKERGTNEVMYPVTSIDCVVGADTVVSKVTELDTKATELDTRVDALELKDKIKFFEEHNTKVHYIIDQRGTISDPDTMVSENFVFDDEGNKVFIPEELKRNPSANCLAWLRANSHAYVTHFVSGVLRIKQLDDTTRKKFADGTSSVNHISDETSDYDVMMKIDADVYYKTEAYIPDGETEPNEDYILVTIARELAPTDNEEDWEKWSKYNLIGVYKGFVANSKLYSLSGKRPTTDTLENLLTYAKAKGDNFNGFKYDAHKVLAILFYGFYSSLDAQKICGYGTKGTRKVTGATDDLAMIDTDSTTGNGAENPDSTQMNDGIGSDIKSINFWNLENIWGDTEELILDLRYMWAGRSPSGLASANETMYISDYIDNYRNIVITDNGVDTTYTDSYEFLSAYNSDYSIVFLAIIDTNNNNIVRAIKLPYKQALGGVPSKMVFGKHSDIIIKSKDDNNGSNYDLYFCDRFDIMSCGSICYRSISGNLNWGGIANINGTRNTVDYCSSRLIYEGTADTIQLITNPMEEL